MSMTRRFTFLMLGLVVLAGVLSACGRGGLDVGSPIEIAISSTTGGAGSLLVAEEGGSEIEQLCVTISEIRLVPDEEEAGPIVGPIDGTSDISCEVSESTDHDPASADDTYTVDLIALSRLAADEVATAYADLGGTTIHQVRFIVVGAEVRFGEKTWEHVTVPSGAQTGLKVNVEIPEGLETVETIELQFDTSRLIERGDGEYNLAPTAVRAFAGE